MNLMLHLALCASLAAALVAVYLYRNWLENHDDPYIHLHNDSHDTNIIDAQTTIGKRLEMVDRVKNGLLAALIVYAIAIAAMGVYLAWNNTGS